MEHSFPSDETLAAFIDGRLDAATRAAVISHVATCDDCYAIIAASAERTGMPPRPVRHPMRRIALAVAASLTLVAIIGGIVFRMREPDLLRGLAAETKHRRIEARITGFPYREYEPPMRGSEADNIARSTSEWKAMRYESEIARRADANPNVKNLHALAVSHLEMGFFDQAAGEFERTLMMETRESTAARAIAKSADATLLSDAAAAYLARGKARRAQADFFAAVEATERAWKLAKQPEIAWNRALAFEEMHVRADAIAAWEAYLRLDPNSQWSVEAREHLKQLRTPTDAQEWQRISPRLAALAADPQQLDNVVRRFAQQSRVVVEETLLPEWASFELAHDARAKEKLTTARAIAASLRRAGGSTLADDAIQTIDASRGEARRKLARGHAAYGAARKLYDGHAFDRAGESFRAASSELQGTPFAAAPDVEGVGVVLMADDFAGVLRAVAVAEKRTAITDRPRLGRMCWLRALAELQLGHPDAALELYRRAETHFVAAREDDNAATVDSLIADALESVGDSEAAMPARMRALEIIARTGATSRNVIMAEAAYAAMSAGRSATAQLFLSPLINHHSAGGGSMWRCTALLWSSSLRAEAGEHDEAFQEIQRAKASCGAISDSRVRQRTLANMTFVETAAPADQVENVKWLDEALRFFREKQNRLCVAGLLDRRGRVHTRADEKQAESDFREALAVIEAERDEISDAGQREVFIAASGRIYADLVDLLLSEQRYVEAFEIAERSRSGEVEHSHHGKRSSRPHSEWLREQLPSNLAIVEYVVRDKSLVAWLVTRNGIAAATTTVARAELMALVERASAHCERADLMKVHDLLIAPWSNNVPRESTIVFVPDPAIERVPFAALVERRSSRYVAQDYATSIATSALSFIASAWTYAERGGDRALLVADPSLDPSHYAALPSLAHARSEVASLAKLYPRATTLVGDSATKTSFRRFAPEANVIDFAGHALAFDAAPRYSSLLFHEEAGDDGRLHVGEVPAESLANARLVVLSACSTARGSGEERGSVTLARAFHSAGVPSVVGTLWPVHDDAGEVFARVFHQSIQTGRTPAAALRDAQLALLGSAKTHLSDPSSWGAFRLIGAAVSLKEDHECRNCASSLQVSAR